MKINPRIIKITGIRVNLNILLINMLINIL